MSFSTTSVNYLPSNGFRMIVRKIPNMIFHLEKVSLPGLSLKSARTENPFVSTPYPGDHIIYDPLVFSFFLNEDMSNYVELYTWIRQSGFSESHDEYGRIKAQERDKRDVTEVSIFLLNSKSRPFIEFQYHDAFPVQMSRVDFDNTIETVEPILISCMFEYTTFSVTRVNEVVPVDNQRWEA